MKRAMTVLSFLVALGLILMPAAGMAQPSGPGPGYGPGGGYPGWYCPYCGQYMGPGMMGPGYGMGPGMMGPGYGMGPGMMGPGYGYGMGPGMMGGGMMGPGYGGYGMGPGMMGRGYGYGMGPGMMGPGYGYGYGYGPQYQQREKPLDKVEAKEEVENYLKSMRNPNLKLGSIEDKGNAFEADIVTKEGGSLVDKILVDKNTGVMRSAY